MNDQDKQKWMQLIGMGVVAAVGLAVMNESRYREISWKEFVSSYLAAGRVEKLEVVNNKWVKVHLNSGIDNEVLWFSIGSVDTFERNLENAQADLGIDVSRSVPVIYKSQLELSNVLSFLPTLLLIGFL